MLTVPFIVTSLTPNGLSEEWYNVFILHAAFLFLTNAVFCKFGTGIAAAFTCSNEKPFNGTSSKQLKEGTGIAAAFICSNEKPSNGTSRKQLKEVSL